MIKFRKVSVRVGVKLSGDLARLLIADDDMWCSRGGHFAEFLSVYPRTCNRAEVSLLRHGAFTHTWDGMGWPALVTPCANAIEIHKVTSANHPIPAQRERECTIKVYSYVPGELQSGPLNVGRNDACVLGAHMWHYFGFIDRAHCRPLCY